MISKILLSGYMGAGKSTIGKRMAEIIQWKFIDLDHFIEQQQELSVSIIFKEKGEAHFRALEKKALESILNTNEHLVLSLGGGTVCHSGIAQELAEKPDVLVCYLKLEPDLLLQRLLNDRFKRPMLNEVQDLKSFIVNHLKARTDYYNMADLTIDNSESIDEICKEIENFKSYLNSSTT